ncbi:MAG: tetratricopeptide repeat protein [Anaerolineales bacterium]|jgi:tetratricopeptide (TPR) repeat protein
MDNQSISNLEKNLEQTIEKGNKEQIIDAYIQLGQAYINSGDTPKGLTQIEEALKTNREINNTEIEARLLGLKGIALKQIGNYTQASQSFRKSLKIAEEIENTVLQSDALLQTGNLLAEQGKNLEAIAKLDNALILSIQNNDNPRKLFIANLLGNVFLSIESYEKAVENYALALETARVLGDKNAQAASLVHIGQTFLQDGEYYGAIEHFELALNSFDESGNAFIEIQALRGLTKAYQGQKKTSLAIVYGEQVLNRVKGIQDLFMELKALQELYELFASDERYEKTLLCLDRCVEIAVELNDLEVKMDAMRKLGIVHYYLENYEFASDNLRTALDIAIQFQNKHEEALILGRLSALKADQGEIERSNEFAAQAISIAQELELDKLKGEQLVILALNNFELGNRKQAIEDCEAAIEVFSDIGASELVEQAREYLERF